MLIGTQIKEKLNFEEKYSFLAYLEDIQIGPQKSNKNILMELHVHQDVTSEMNIQELHKQVRLFTKLVYARFPRFSNSFRVIVRRVTLQQVKGRYIIIIKYN